ncbi:hypothetical protein IZY60_10235 [Lutibacter sp. B2]|nr:hypothetical protein [Lutibacter sp. B2]
MNTSSNIQLMEKLIERFDYRGAIEIMKMEEDVNIRALKVLYCCKYRLNFDFQSAIQEVDDLIENQIKDRQIRDMKINLEGLVAGKPDEIFSELLENTKIQLINRRYIDFLSRVYRMKEAVLKYIFVKNHVGKDKFSFMTEVVSKRMILKILRKKYKIYNPNLSFAITSYINKYLKNDKRYMKVLEVLNSDKMNKIIELRNDCICGHGFKGVNKEVLENIYGDPFNIINDFILVFKKMDVKIVRNSYDKINRYLTNEIEKDSYSNCLENK